MGFLNKKQRKELLKEHRLGFSYKKPKVVSGKANCEEQMTFMISTPAKNLFREA